MIDPLVATILDAALIVACAVMAVVFFALVLALGLAAAAGDSDDAADRPRGPSHPRTRP